MKNIFLFITFLSISHNLTAFEHYSMGESSISNVRDSQTGLALASYSTAQDHSHFSLGAMTNPDIRKSSELLGVEAEYAIRQKFGWLKFQASQISAKTKKITNDQSFLNSLSQDIDESKSSITTLSVGLGLRTRYAEHFLGQGWYETLAAGLTYSQLNESELEHSLSGPGIKSEFGVYKRSSQKLSLGVKASYQISSLKRPSDFEGESSSIRTSSFNWITVAFELKLYF